MATGAFAIKGLPELVRAFDKFNRDLVDDLGMELGEAVDPARKVAESYVTPGGGGFPGMRGVVGRSAYVRDMRTGFSRRDAAAWIAPAWSSNKGTLQGAILAVNLRWRMEGAVEDTAGEIEGRVGHFIDTLADHWGE